MQNRNRRLPFLSTALGSVLVGRGCLKAESRNGPVEGVQLHEALECLGLESNRRDQLTLSIRIDETDRYRNYLRSSCVPKELEIRTALESTVRNLRTARVGDEAGE